MKNICIYDYFLNNINSNFRIRYFLISLSRTFIFNVSSNVVYYRKANKSRKMFFKGFERKILSTDGILKRFNFFNKMGIKNIDNVIGEYLSCGTFEEEDFCDFILDKETDFKIDGDCIIKNDVVSMHFDSKKGDTKIKHMVKAGFLL